MEKKLRELSSLPIYPDGHVHHLIKAEKQRNIRKINMFILALTKQTLVRLLSKITYQLLRNRKKCHYLSNKR